MKKQIVMAIALPILLASATSSFASEVVKKPVITPSITLKPVVSAPVIGGGQTNRPGEPSIGKKPVKPPSPPRREPILLNQRQILQPVNSTVSN
ncbi:hypothetical protein NIES4075_60060 [Tolypothrix sp. NIES-4075]|uniref:hypothetical protein n=1 Tax=Tolypothrix sp. NIES-4075 TaxID=2005459 RepID=UPI000B5C6678|nr:hypothetical protein [Tolypothrix sp. NIES-4075]GAX44987.1 hypothetical protein NIES4075_60060 [Tolypothrix sp. NIES-4075]